MYLFVNFFCKINIDWPRIPHHNLLMIARASIISESEISITVLCLLCSPHNTAVRIKNCSKSTSKLPLREMWWCCGPPSYRLKLKYLLPVSVSYVRRVSMNQEVFEKHLCIKTSHYEKYGWFLVTHRKPSRATTKLMLFTVNKDFDFLISIWF